MILRSLLKGSVFSRSLSSPKMHPDRQLPWYEGSQDVTSSGQLPQIRADADCYLLEETLRSTRAELQQYRTLYESLPSIYFTLDAAGVVLKVNQFGAARLGYAVEEIADRTIFSLFHPEDQPLLQAAIAVSLQYPNQVANWEFRAFCKNYNCLWVNATVRAVPGFGFQQQKESPSSSLLEQDMAQRQPANSDTAILFVCEDITERKRIEEALRDIESRYYTLAKMSPVGIFHIDTDGNCLYVNERWRDIAGLTLGSALGIGWQQAIHPEDKERVLLEWDRALQANRPFRYEYRFRRPDGVTTWVFGQAVAEKNIDGSLAGFIGTITDITERKLSEEALRQQAERERLMAAVRDRVRRSLNLEEILKTTVAEVRQFLACDRVLIYRFAADWHGTFAVESVAHGCQTVLGIQLKDTCFSNYPNVLQAFQAGSIRAVEDVERANFSECYVNFLAQLQVKASLIVPILQHQVELELLSEQPLSLSYSKDTCNSEASPTIAVNSLGTSCTALPSPLWGLLIAHQCSSTRQWQPWEIELLSSLATQVGIAIEQAQLYHQLQTANQTLQRLASLDGLTQLANRRRFDEYLEQEWQRLTREQTPLSLILCDIDFFKAYNDNYGHLAGDLCLQKVANAIAKTLRRPADLAARYGGEEFAVILPNTPRQGAIYVANNIRQQLQQLAIAHVKSPVSSCITLSLGITSIVPSQTILPAALISAADRALYQAKAEGRDRAVFREC